MGRFNSLRRTMGGFMVPLPEQPPAQPERPDEGAAEPLHRIEIIGRFIIKQLRILERQMADNDATTQQILEAVRAQRGAIASLSTMLGGMKARLNAALAGEISPKGTAILNDIMSEIQGNSRAMTQALANNDDDPTNDVNEDGSPKSGNISDGASGNAQAEQRLISTSTTLSTSKAVAMAGETISLSAGVSSSGGGDKALTGTVTFASEDEEIGRAGLDSTGVAALSIADLPQGDHEITATYAGDDTYAPSTSQSLTQTVMPPADPRQDDQKTQIGNGNADTQVGTQAQQGGNATPGANPGVASGQQG